MNTNISTAEVAPKPANRVIGFLPSRMATTTTPATKSINILSTPQKVWKYCWAEERRSSLFSNPLNEPMNTNAVRTDITTI